MKKKSLAEMRFKFRIAKAEFSAKAKMKLGILKKFKSKSQIACALGANSIEQAQEFCRRNNIDITGLPDYLPSERHSKQIG